MVFNRSPSMRSKLFVPGSRPELFEKAWNSAADAICFDLENAVPADRKAKARGDVAWFLGRHANDAKTAAKIAIVRVNPWGEELFADDMAAVVRPGLDIVNLPKIEGADPIIETARLLDRLERKNRIERPIGILANIETPRGLRVAAEIALADERVIGLQLAFGDLFEPLAIERSPAVLLPIRLAVRLAAAEAGIDAFDGAFAVSDGEAFRADAEAARALGLAGKSCIHPRQIAVANAVFFPCPTEIESARRIVDKADKTAVRGTGAFTVVGGTMADVPFIDRARAVLKIAGSAGDHV